MRGLDCVLSGLLRAMGTHLYFLFCIPPCSLLGHPSQQTNMLFIYPTIFLSSICIFCLSTYQPIYPLPTTYLPVTSLPIIWLSTHLPSSTLYPLSLGYYLISLCPFKRNFLG